jgi:hypothetical protein
MKFYMLTLVALAGIVGCSSGNESQPGNTSSSSAPPAAQETQALLGRAAFQKTYISARGWQPDAMPYEEHSQPTKEVPGEEGKAAVWTAGFGSVNRGLAKTFTWSGITHSMTPSAEDTFDPRNSSTHTFDLGFLKTESDAAYKIAQEHGGKKLTDRDPKIPIAYRLGWSQRDNTLEWHVMYGGDADPKLTVAINATTGQFVRIEK